MFVTFVEDTPASKKIPWANTLMILLNVVVAYRALSQPDTLQVLGDYGFIPVRHLGWGFLTGPFLHSSWVQLVTNMTFLFMFGKGVEERIGRRNYLFAYLLIAYFSEGVHWYFNQDSVLPLIGASRVVTGLGVMYLFMYPWGKMKWVFSFFGAPLLEIPSRTAYVMGFWAVIQLGLAFLPWGRMAALFHTMNKMGITLVTTNPTAGTAWKSHLGALALGTVLHFLMPQKKSKG
ncbi:MAG TPA: rhomboid family intramembrane serine protease [bacterium]|nr:rhomboid family intramembrane serine protease [bacterium]